VAIVKRDIKVMGKKDIKEKVKVVLATIAAEQLNAIMKVPTHQYKK